MFRTITIGVQILLLVLTVRHRVIPNVVRVLPSTCVTFVVYENTKFYLPRLYDTHSKDESEVA